MVFVRDAFPCPFRPALCLLLLARTMRGMASRSFHPFAASVSFGCCVCCEICVQVCCNSCIYMAWHCGGIWRVVGVHSSIVSHGMVESPWSGGSSSRLFGWSGVEFVGWWLGAGCVPALMWMSMMSCLISSGVSGGICIGTCGQAVAKHLGCQDSP